MIFNNGDLHEQLPLTGAELHVFMRATDMGATNIAPLVQTTGSHAKLKAALHYKATDLASTSAALTCSKVEAPLLIIPDVQTSAFTPEQAGALGGQAIALGVSGGLNSCILFTETSTGAPDGMYIPVASAFAYEPADSASGVSFVLTAAVCFKLEVLGTLGKREYALASETDKPVTGGKGARLFILPTSIIASKLVLPDWRITQDLELEKLVGSALLQSDVFCPLVTAGLLPPDPLQAYKALKEWRQESAKACASASLASPLRPLDDVIATSAVSSLAISIAKPFRSAVAADIIQQQLQEFKQKCAFICKVAQEVARPACHSGKQQKGTAEGTTQKGASHNFQREFARCMQQLYADKHAAHPPKLKPITTKPAKPAKQKPDEQPPEAAPPAAAGNAPGNRRSSRQPPAPAKLASAPAPAPASAPAKTTAPKKADSSANPSEPPVTPDALAALMRAHDANASQRANVEKQLEAAQAQMTELQKRVGTLQASEANLKAQNSSLSRENKRLETQVGEQATRISSLTEAVVKAQAEVGILTQKAEDAKANAFTWASHASMLATATHAQPQPAAHTAAHTQPAAHAAAQAQPAAHTAAQAQPAAHTAAHPAQPAAYAQPPLASQLPPLQPFHQFQPSPLPQQFMPVMPHPMMLPPHMMPTYGGGYGSPGGYQLGSPGFASPHVHQPPPSSGPQ